MNTNIESLKEGFEQIKIKHFNSETYKGTHAALVKEGKVFLGIAKCNPKDQFNRRLGREISLGRALHAWKVDAGVEVTRGASSVYTIETHSPEELEIVLEKQVFTEPTPTLEPVAPMLGSAGGCCGGGACKD